MIGSLNVGWGIYCAGDRGLRGSRSVRKINPFFALHNVCSALDISTLIYIDIDGWVWRCGCTLDT